MSEINRAPIAAIRALIEDALTAAGLPREDAAVCARLMGEADLTGADAHGVFRLPQYVRRLKAGGFNKRPNIRVDRNAPATALVDGDNAMGHLVMSRAAETAISLARETGVSWVGVRRSNHAGPAGLYAEMPAAQGMIGLYAAVANANHMAVWGGADPLLGTNPLAIGVPSGAGPMVLDMATTVVSYGTVKNYALQGKPMEKGWMVNTATGEDIVDARRAAEGLLLPIGGYKGSGLAVMLGFLAGPLNRAVFGRDVIDFNADDASETNTGHF
ncbi:MAG: Ldh family oxidoreductase, partial [Alphaproteobacteria bacterium]